MQLITKQFLLFIKRFVFGLGFSFIVVSVLPTDNLSNNYSLINTFVGATFAAEDDEGRRPPPSTRTASTLGRAVYSRIEEVQEFKDAEQYTEALEVLAEIKELYDRDRLNDYETYMMYVFYASIFMETNDYTKAIEYWSEILNIEELAPDNRGQALVTLGQLMQAEGNFEQAIDYYKEYLEIIETPDNGISLRISMAYYALENYQEALPWVLEHIDLERADGNEIPENTYQILKSLYFSLDDYASARQVLREMIIIFDAQDEWGQLAQIEGQLENLQGQTSTYYMADLKNYLDREGQLMTLAYQIYGNDDPWGAAKLIERGIEDGIIEASDENLSFMSLCYQVAREDELAIGPLLQAVELTEDGNFYRRLGQLYANNLQHEQAADALLKALDTDDVEREDQLLLELSRTYIQLDRYEDAIDAANRASRADSRSADTAITYANSIGLMKERFDRIQEQRRDLADWL